MSTFNIYVGFGGAGGEALACLSDFIARDFQASQQADRRYCFLLADTSENDLGSSMKRIEQNLSRVCGPENIMVDKILLGTPFVDHQSFTRALNSKWQTIKKRAESGEPRHEKHLNQLKETWWMDWDDSPFCFPGVVNPSQGASQMPLASRLMAWWNADSINSKVKSCVRDFRNRFRPEEEVKPELFLVTSLAGGTGRGSWATLAFMFRKAFAEFNIFPNPVGLFLDAGCFESINFKNETDRVRIKLNSLTGVSEIYMFFRNAINNKKEKSVYSLVSLDGSGVSVFNPGDIDPSGHQKDWKGHAPVEKAVFFFKDNEYVTGFKGKSDYFKLVGQTLYSMSTQRDWYKDLCENSSQDPLCAAAASSACVPADKIMDYVKLLMQERIIAKELVERGPEELEEKLAEALLPLNKRSAFESLQGGILAHAQPLKNALIQSLRDQDMDRVLANAKQASQVRVPFRTGLETWYLNLPFAGGAAKGGKLDEKTLADLNFDSHQLALDGIVRYLLSDKLFQSDDIKERLTLKECIKALDVLKENWGVSLQNAGALGGVAGAGKTPGKRKDSLTTLIERTSRKGKILWGVRWDAEEIALIQKEYESLIRSTNEAHLQKELDAISPMVVELLDEVAGLMRKLAKALDEDARQRTAIVLEDTRSKVFRDFGQAVSDPTILVEDTVYTPDSRVSYELKPALSDEIKKLLDDKVDHMVSGYGGQSEQDAAYQAQASRAVKHVHEARRQIAEMMVEESRTKGRVKDELARLNGVLVSYEAAMQSLECPPQFVAEQFSLKSVVGSYLDVAAEAYTKMPEAKRKLFAENISNLFGFDCTKKNPDTNIQKAVANLAAYIAVNCQPLVRMRDKGKQNVNVYVPDIGWDDKTAKERFFESDAAKKGKLAEKSGEDVRTAEVKIYKEQPFAVMAFSSVLFTKWDDDEHLDDLGVHSLNYWKESGGSASENLQDYLHAAEESKDPLKNLAVGGPIWAKAGGIGFTDPRFVFDPSWSDKRWKPWANAGRSAEEDLDKKAVFLAYLCLGNVASSKPAKDEAIAVELLKKFEAEGWEMPLLNRSPEGRAWSWKRPVYERDSDGKPTEGDSSACSWRTTDKMKSLWEMCAAFEKLTDNDFKSIQTEIALLNDLLTKEWQDVTRPQLKALGKSARRFLDELVKNEVEENYNEEGQQEKQKKMKKLLQAATKATDKLFQTGQ